MGSSELGVCGKCTKVIFILLNVLYMLMGLALVGVGSWLLHSNESLDFFTGNKFFSGAALIIICGIVVFFITVMGIAGALLQIRLLLVAYMLVIVVVIVLEVAAGILGFVYKSELENTAANRATDAVMNYRADDDAERNRGNNNAIDFIQNNFLCCGWNSSEQWFSSPYFKEKDQYPESCECDNTTVTTCVLDAVTSQSIYNTTCDDEVTSALSRNVIALGGVGIAFGVLQILPVFLALVLCIAIQRAKNEYVQV